jgi:hypothetical protein
MKIFLVIIFSLVSMVGVAHALGPPSFTIACPLNLCDIEQTVQRIANVLFTVSIPIFSIMIIVGGFQIMTAGGEEEGLRKGRKTLLYALIGFVVIFFSVTAALIIKSIFS